MKISSIVLITSEFSPYQGLVYIIVMLMQCCSCLKWHLGLRAFFLILNVVSRVCIGNALIGLLGWRRAPPSGQTNSSRYTLEL